MGHPCYKTVEELQAMPYAVEGKMRKFYIKILLAVSLCFLCGTSGIADVLQPPGSRVSIEAPPGFVVGQGFTGLFKPGGSSFIVADFPASAYHDFQRKLSDPKRLPKNNFNASRFLKLDRSGEYYAIEGTAVLDGVPYTRFLVLMHDAETTALVTASIPDRELESGAVRRDDVVRALTSVALRIRSSENLAFALGYVGSFQFVNQAPDGGVTYAMAGRHWDDGKDQLEPMLLISVMPWQITSEQKKQEFAVELLKKPFFQTDVEIKNVQNVRIDGMSGWAFDVAYTFVNKKGGKEPANIYAVLLDGGDQYVWFKGTMPRQNADILFPEYRKIASSFSLRR